MKPLRKINREMLIVAVAALVALLFTATPALAKVTGPCADCHTMHNSQDGVPMAENYLGVAQATPNDTLLIYGCVGCHYGDFTALDTTPKVWQPTPTSTTVGTSLAGGNFKWCATDDAKGHNVVGVAAVDTTAMPTGTPPGYGSGLLGPEGTTMRAPTTTNQLTCAGVYGCHGTPAQDTNFGGLAGAHHGDENANGFSDGTTIAKSYRFLFGIKGVEDSDWECNATELEHNQYYGVNRTANETTPDTATISHLCCECHGNFHIAENLNSETYGDSPWNRHPTDFDMTDARGSEYAFYNTASGTVGEYSILAPVGSDLTGLTGAAGTGASHVVSDIFAVGNLANNTAIVTCISCHRAHGSEFDDLLRWDYMDEGATGDGDAASGVATGSGCFVCHTTKDDI